MLVPTAATGAIALPGSGCQHIRVLEKYEAEQVQPAYRDRIASPAPAQLRQLSRAANLLPALPCQAVRRVVFVEFPDETQLLGWTMANGSHDMVYLNAARGAAWNHLAIDASPTAQARAIQNFVHEATHSAIRLLQSQQEQDPVQDDILGVWIKPLGGRPDPSQWDEAARALAKATLDRLGLGDGALREWVRIHESWRALGLAGPYYGDRWDHEETERLAHEQNGFATSYGGQAPIEDMAELAAWAVTGHLFVAGARAVYKDRACPALRRNGGDGIPDSLAAVFSKLSLLQGLGLVDRRSFEHCAGPGLQPLVDPSPPGFGRNTP